MTSMALLMPIGHLTSTIVGPPAGIVSTSVTTSFLGLHENNQVVAHSSTKYEYRALAHGASKLSWLQSLLRELQCSLGSVPVLWSDNIGAGYVATNLVFHARAKHIEIDIHFVHDKVLQKTLEVRFVPSSKQVADILTKVLLTPRFTSLHSKLNVQDTPFRLRGS